MARKKQAEADVEPDELEASSVSSESEESDDDFEPEDFEAGSDDFVDSDVDLDDVDEVDEVDAVATDDEDAPLEELASASEETSEDAPLLLSKDEEFEDYDDEDDDQEVEGLREGEFVCSDCSMVFRLTALADEKAMLCRDCV